MPEKSTKPTDPTEQTEPTVTDPATPSTEPVTDATPPEPANDQAPETSPEPTALRYAGDGDEFFSGVPRRDLTAGEVAEIEPAVLRNITAPNPTTGKALYVPAAPAKE